MIGVEQVLSTLTERFLEILLIAADHIRILVAEAESTGCILCIQRLRTLRRHLDAVVDRLSATTDAAARAGHDFDEIILDGLLPKCIEELRRIAEAVYDRDTSRATLAVAGRFLPAFLTTDIMERIRDMTNGRVCVGPGTLYNLLERFQEAGMICLTKVEGRRRSYRITEAGLEALEQEYQRLNQLAADYRAFGQKGLSEHGS